MFSTSFQAALDSRGNAIAETGAVPPADYEANSSAVGANVLSLLSTGPIEYDGRPGARIVVSASGGVLGQTLYAELGGVNPVNAFGDTLTLGVPEPSAALLVSLAVAGCSARRRSGERGVTR